MGIWGHLGTSLEVGLGGSILGHSRVILGPYLDPISETS